MPYYMAKVAVDLTPDGSDKPKKKTYVYAVDAYSVTEAEATVIQEWKDSPHPYEVTSVVLTPIEKILYPKGTDQ